MMNLQSALRGAYRSRTLWVSMAMAVAGIIESQAQSVAQFLPRNAYAHVMIVCAVVMGVLRVLTIESISEKGGGEREPGGDSNARGSGERDRSPDGRVDAPDAGRH